MSRMKPITRTHWSLRLPLRNGIAVEHGFLAGLPGTLSTRRQLSLKRAASEQQLNRMMCHTAATPSRQLIPLASMPTRGIVQIGCRDAKSESRDLPSPGSNPNRRDSIRRILISQREILVQFPYHNKAREEIASSVRSRLRTVEVRCTVGRLP